MLNKYLNYSLMKMNDSFVQERFKQFIKQRANHSENKQEDVYSRLMRNAEEKTHQNLQLLSMLYDDGKDSKFMNHSK